MPPHISRATPCRPRHTPGPWEACPIYSSAGHPGDALVMIHAGHEPGLRRLVAEANYAPEHAQHEYHVSDKAEAEANARLIAAAPEMLLALEAALVDIENALPYLPYNTDPALQDVLRTVVLIRATIAKAAQPGMQRTSEREAA